MSQGYQPGLFGDDPPPGTRPVAAAEVPEELRQLAAAVPSQVRLGTSSWSFPGWVGSVYRRSHSAERLGRDGLPAYARHPLLRAVGIDRTYYAPITAGDFARYRDAVPADFRFLVKAHQAVTQPHLGDRPGTSPVYLDPGYAAAEVIGPAHEGLGDKAAVVLFQFSPQAAGRDDAGAFADRLHAFLTALPSGVRYAVELRDRHLLGPRYRAALDACGAVHCLNVHSAMPSPDEQLRRLGAATGSARSAPVVIRWMLGGDHSYASAVREFTPFDRLRREDPAARTQIAALCRQAALEHQEALVIINNKAEGSAPHSVVALARALASGAA